MMIELTEHEYLMCVLFAEQSARSQQRIEFGNHKTEKRPLREVREDTLCGKMGEVAVAKFLRGYSLRLPVNYEVYPRGEWDDEDFIVNGLSVDVKTTQRGRSLLLEKNKVDFRVKQGKFPDIIILCRADVETLKVCIIGCISTKKLIDPSNDKVRRLRAGENIPGTNTALQADNYCVFFEDLCDVKTAFDFILKEEGDV